MASPQDAQLTEAQTAHFAEHGFVVIPGLVSDGDCKLADTEVGRLLDEEPPSQDRVGSYFIWRHSNETPTLFSTSSPVRHHGCGCRTRASEQD